MDASSLTGHRSGQCCALPRTTLSLPATLIGALMYYCKLVTCSVPEDMSGHWAPTRRRRDRPVRPDSHTTNVQYVHSTRALALDSQSAGFWLSSPSNIAP